MLLASGTASVIHNYRFNSIRCSAVREFDRRVATSIECTTTTIDLSACEVWMGTHRHVQEEEGTVSATTI